MLSIVYNMTWPSNRTLTEDEVILMASLVGLEAYSVEEAVCQLEGEGVAEFARPRFDGTADIRYGEDPEALCISPPVLPEEPPLDDDWGHKYDDRPKPGRERRNGKGRQIETTGSAARSRRERETGSGVERTLLRYRVRPRLLRRQVSEECEEQL